MSERIKIQNKKGAEFVYIAIAIPVVISLLPGAGVLIAERQQNNQKIKTWSKTKWPQL